jgi:hypothetical protein
VKIGNWLFKEPPPGKVYRVQVMLLIDRVNEYVKREGTFHVPLMITGVLAHAAFTSLPKMARDSILYESAPIANSTQDL